MTARTFGLHARHVLAVYERAPAEVRSAGMDWYAGATRALADLAPDHSRWVAAGVLAALSPRMPWERNLSLAAVALRTGKAVSALSANLAKADAILGLADPWNVLKGRKVRSFYLCLLNPAHESEVCIDRHAVCIAAGKRLSEKRGQRILSAVGGYDRAQDCYRLAAAAACILPSQMQAVTWLQWRMES